MRSPHGFFVPDRVAMPGLSALELQERLSLDGCPFPIIFIAALDDAHVQAQAPAAGASGFSPSPSTMKSFWPRSEQR